MSTTNPMSPAQTDVKDQIRGFILEHLAQPKGIASVTDTEHLMESGVIDSLGIFRLVSFLEDELGVRVDDQEINIDTMKSVDTIAELVGRKRAK